MSSNYDLIATVDIDIKASIVDETSFGNMLIVGPMPANASKTPADVSAYTSLSEVINAGWLANDTTVEEDGTVKTLKADPVGIAAKIAFSQNPAPSKIYIAPVKSGDSNSTVAIGRAIDTADWHVVCSAGVEDYEKIAEYIETTKKMFFYTDLLTPALLDPDEKAPVGTKYLKSVGIYGKVTATQSTEEIPEGNRYINVAFAAALLGYQPGTVTAAFKKLSGISPSKLTGTEIDALIARNTNYFVEVGSRSVTMLGKTVSGEWIDVVRFRDWLLNDMQTRVVNLFISNPKITLNDAGIVLIQNQMLASLKSGQDIGGIAQDEYDSEGNTIPGYSTSVPVSANLTEEEKSSRSLKGFVFTARLAGAIHCADLKGTLSYSL